MNYIGTGRAEFKHVEMEALVIDALCVNN